MGGFRLSCSCFEGLACSWQGLFYRFSGVYKGRLAFLWLGLYKGLIEV